MRPTSHSCDAQRDGDLSAQGTAKASQALAGTDNSDVRQTIRDLGDTQQRKAYTLVGETGDDGVELVRKLDDSTKQKLLASKTTTIRSTNSTN